MATTTPPATTGAASPARVCTADIARPRSSTSRPSPTCSNRRGIGRSSGLRTECAGLGGDGVVGVKLTVASFYGNGLEFMAIGTAVSGDGVTKHPKKPFTSDLSGQDFAKLMRAGWVPVDLVQGVGAVIRHDDWAARMQQGSWVNQEIVGSTALITAARAAARESLAKDAAKRGGHSVVAAGHRTQQVRGAMLALAKKAKTRSSTRSSGVPRSRRSTPVPPSLALRAAADVAPRQARFI